MASANTDSTARPLTCAPATFWWPPPPKCSMMTWTLSSPVERAEMPTVPSLSAKTTMLMRAFSMRSRESAVCAAMTWMFGMFDGMAVAMRPPAKNCACASARASATVVS